MVTVFAAGFFVSNATRSQVSARCDSEEYFVGDGGWLAIAGRGRRGQTLCLDDRAHARDLYTVWIFAKIPDLGRQPAAIVHTSSPRRRAVVDLLYYCVRVITTRTITLLLLSSWVCTCLACCSLPGRPRRRRGVGK